ncbi:hypothetical protein JW756_06575 [Candidatus Woesearchaeota archaeon]|nr:hypothetical protein [Candidatus Woesearchaeota archaeon]
MQLISAWTEAKSKERLSHNFVKTVLELSGYKLMNFGVENHNQEIIKEIKKNYSCETNRRLLSMPDFVVIDPETKESWLIEVKHRTLKEKFEMKKSNIAFGYGHMKSYLDFWKEATLILTFNVTPFCLCVDFKEINWDIHFKGKFKNNDGTLDEVWNFCGAYQIINKKFPKVTNDTFKKTLHILGLNKD